MTAWIECPSCRLKHTARPDGLCPRCRGPIARRAAVGGDAHPGAALEVLATVVAPPPGERSPAPEAPRRVWTVLLAWVVVVVASALASIAVVFVAIGTRALREPGLAREGAAFEDVLRASMESAGVLLGAAIATAAVQVVVALAAARLSREPLRARLGLGGPRVGTAAIAVGALGCAAVSSSFDAAFGALGLEATGSIAELGRIIAGLSPGGLAVAVAVAGVAAPVAEELFFRGYVQTRLCRRWGTWPGIVATAALFGLIHFDPIHSTAAFLIGLYLGWLAARSGSIVPAIAAHAANNVLWAVATWAGAGSHLARGTHAALLAVCAAGAVAAIAWLRPRLTASAAPAAPALADARP